MVDRLVVVGLGIARREADISTRCDGYGTLS
jgi:hypothetical protein